MTSLTQNISLVYAGPPPVRRGSEQDQSQILITDKDLQRGPTEQSEYTGAGGRGFKVQTLQAFILYMHYTLFF